MINNLLNIGLLQYSVITEAFLALASLVLIVIGVRRSDKETSRIALLAIFALIIGLILTVGVNSGIYNPFEDYYRVDLFTTVIKSLVIITAVISLILYVGHLDYNPNNSRFEYPIIMVLSVVGMLILVSAKDFLSLYMGLELQSLAIYVLAAINKKNLKSTEAGFKYFVLGALGSAILLYGVSLIYGFSGTLNFLEIQESLRSVGQPHLGVIIGLVLVVIALCFKISAVPFHMWTPDVYEGAPTPVTLFMATTPKIVGFVVLFRVLSEAFADYYNDWQNMILFLAVASLLVGALGAVRQQNFKRLLAYSSINHVGFMLLGILTFDKIGIQAVLLYLVLYVTLVFGAFAFLMLVKQSHHSADGADKKPLEDISAYSGLSETMPLTALGMVILLFSMSGIPPFAGFFAKLYIFKATLTSEYYVTSVLAAISAVIAAYYYLKIVKIMFFDKPIENYDKTPTLPTRIIFTLMVIFNLLFFIKAEFLFDITRYSVDLLF